jgi:hypothetical protein
VVLVRGVLGALAVVGIVVEEEDVGAVGVGAVEVEVEVEADVEGVGVEVEIDLTDPILFEMWAAGCTDRFYNPSQIYNILGRTRCSLLFDGLFQLSHCRSGACTFRS